MHKVLYKFFFSLLLVITLVSCDKDFNEIGGNVIGDEKIGFDVDTTKTVVAYNQNTGIVQTNNLPINSLGCYSDPVFGKVTANVVTQLELPSANPVFGVNPKISKVVLTIPYFSKIVTTDASGNSTYTLDSIHGAGKIKLGVYESKYYIRDLDGGSSFQNSQSYYADATSDINNAINLIRLNDSSNVSENDQFEFSSNEIITYKTDENNNQIIDTRSAPGMKLNLNNDFFQDKIFGVNASGKLFNNNTFKEYFRGLYFKSENISGQSEYGSLGQLNFKQGKVTITYTSDITDSNGVVTNLETTYVLNITGNTINTFENEFNSTYSNAINSFNSTIGDPKLFLKGGVGSMAVIQLFGEKDLISFDANGNKVNSPNGVSDELDALRNPIDGKKWLVNEANLTFYIDKNAMANSTDPQRIYLFDLNNHRPIIDYYVDNTTSYNSKNNKYIHGGLLEKESSSVTKGYRYKIRLTNHIHNLIQHADSTNVKLGLVVTESIGLVTSTKLKNALTNPVSIDRNPSASTLSPLGTILYGNNIPVSDPNYKKRLKLEIYYTKPN